MTDLMFNELLEVECRQVAAFYQLETHYEPYEYMRIAGDGPDGTAVNYIEPINPGDHDIIPFVRRIGALYGCTYDQFEPLAIFVVQAQLAINLQQPGSPAQRVITVYGVTNDGRYNMAVIPGQWDEDGRLYAEPTDVLHWRKDPDFHINVMPYLEFFWSNDKLRIKELV